MADWASILDAAANLLWPAIVIFALYRFRSEIGQVIESAKSRRFTIKIGGQELTMDEVSKQQSVVLADLQAQVGALRKAVGLDRLPTPTAVAARGATRSAPTAVLWVDGDPKKNSYLIHMLTTRGVDVDRVSTTTEALASLASRDYAFVVSDIGRTEGDVFKPEAGLELVPLVRQTDQTVPLILYTSHRGVREHAAAALAAGASLVTSSPTELAGFIEQ